MDEKIKSTDNLTMVGTPMEIVSDARRIFDNLGIITYGPRDTAQKLKKYERLLISVDESTMHKVIELMYDSMRKQLHEGRDELIKLDKSMDDFCGYMDKEELTDSDKQYLENIVSSNEFVEKLTSPVMLTLTLLNSEMRKKMCLKYVEKLLTSRNSYILISSNKLFTNIGRIVNEVSRFYLYDEFTEAGITDKVVKNIYEQLNKKNSEYVVNIITPLFSIVGAADKHIEDLFLKIFNYFENNQDTISQDVLRTGVKNIQWFITGHAPFVLKKLRSVIKKSSIYQNHKDLFQGL